MRTQLAPPTTTTQAHQPPPATPGSTPPGRPRLRGYRRILGLGLAAVVYLLMVNRAAELDSQVGELEKELAEARFELLQAKAEFYDTVCAIPAPPADPARDDQAPALTPPETLRVVGLPALQPSVLRDAAGWGALAQVSPPPATAKGGAVRLAQQR